MRIQSVKLLWIAVAIVASVTSADAQRSKRQRSSYGSPTPSTGQTTTPANKKSNYGDAQQTNQPSRNNYNSTPGSDTTAPADDLNVPVDTVRTSGGGGFSDSTKQTVLGIIDGAYEPNMIMQRDILPYQSIREDDAVYRVRVWREIDTREKINQPFRYAAVEDNGDQHFVAILLKAIKEDSASFLAFSNDDDRFTTPITYDDALKAMTKAMTGGNAYTKSKKFDAEGNVVGYEVRQAPVELDSIYKFQIKEDWIFDKNTSRLTVRILGIAPVAGYKLSTGELMQGSEQPLFWVYYPNLRPIIAKYQAYNPKNLSSRMTWEELFENRVFSSYIVKSTLDNPKDQAFSKYINDPLFRLYAGDKIKDKIFDYEQALWSY
jgi:gliding motility associated protien GldN